MHEKQQYSSSRTCQNGKLTPEKRRFLRINKSLAALLVLLVCLLSANAALAWLSDTDEISNDLSIKETSKSYASIIKPADGSEKTILVFGTGEPTYSSDEVIETYYDIENLDDGTSVPWKNHIADIESVIIDGAISPSNMNMWFAGATKLTSLDLTGISAKNLVSSIGVFDGCDHLEQITIPPTFHFEGDPSLPSPDPSKIDDADGYWYLLDEVEYNDEPKTTDDVAGLIESRYGADQPTKIYAYGRGYAALYGGTMLVFGRGIPSDTYKGLALNATYRGLETGDGDFNPQASSESQHSPWPKNLTDVESIAKHPIKTPSIKCWFYFCQNLRSIDMSSIDLSECTTMEAAFWVCSSLSNIDVSSWDVSNVESLARTFELCRNIEKLDVSNWHLPKLGASGGSRGGPLSGTFYGCEKLEVIDTSNWNVITTNNFFAGANNSSRQFIVNCTNLRVIDLSGITITEDPATSSNRNLWSFTGCPNIEKLIVPSRFCTSNTNILSALNSNRNGYVNSNYWYEEGQGPALDGADVALRIQQLFEAENSPEKTTFYSDRAFTDEDTYAAYYVGSGDNILVFGRGAEIPESYENAALSNAYREIETRCGGSQNSTPWHTVNQYVKRVVINADLVPQNCGFWFANAYQNKTITGLDRFEMSKCKSAERMFYGNRELIELNMPTWNFASCETFSGMFQECQKLQKISVDGWTFSNNLRADAFQNIFRETYSVTELDLSSWEIEQSSNSAFSFNDSFSYCRQLQKLSFPHLVGNSSPATGNVWTSWYYGGTFYECGELHELIVPNDFSFSSVIIPNGKDGLNNVYTGGRWYLDKQGDGKTAELLQDDLLSRFKNGSDATHWYIDKNWTDEDAYAAFYGDLMLFDRGATIADTIDGKSVEKIYRNIEGEDYLAQWAFTNSSYPNNATTTVKFNADIYPRNLTNYFKYFVALENIENIESLKTNNVSSCKEMFSFCRALRNIDVSFFDVSSATNFESMFCNCDSLEKVELFNIDATQDHIFNSMFAGCTVLTRLDLSRWNMPRWNTTNPTNSIMSGCTNLEEITVSPTFNFSMMANGVGASSVAFPYEYISNGKYLYSPLWYKNGQGRGYAYYDADDQVNATYGEGTDSITWTRHPLEEAYAAVYKASGTENYSLVFGRGLISDLEDSYYGHELIGVALGYEEYSFYDMQGGNKMTQPWSSFAASITEVIVKDEVRPVSMEQWFRGLLNCSIFSNIDKVNTSNCTNLWGTFNDCRSIEELDLSSWDTSKVTRYGSGGYNSLFYNCLKLKKISLAGWDLSSLTTKNEMFSICPALEEIDMSGCIYENAPTLMSQCFKLKKVVISPEMSFAGDFFAAAYDATEGFDGKWYLESDLKRSFTTAEAKTYINDRFRTENDSVTLVAGYGTSAYAAIYKDPNSNARKLAFGRGFAERALNGWTQEAAYRGIESNIYNALGTSPSASNTPWNAVSGSIVEVVNVLTDDADKIAPASLNAWFAGMENLSSIELSMFDVSNTKDISSILYACRSLTDVRGLETWNTSNVESMSNAFAGVKGDFASDISAWDTSKVKDMGWMFWGCTGITNLDLSRWSTASLTNNTNAFYQCSAIQTLKLPANFVKSSMTTIGQMFWECRSITTIDSSDWDTSKLNNLTGLFYNCESLQKVVGIESWNTSSVTEMVDTFHNCYSIVADLRTWNVANVVSNSGFSYAAASTLIEPNWPQTASLQSEDPMAQVDNIVDSQSDFLTMTLMANYAPECYVAAPVESKQINALVKLEPVSGSKEGIGDR